MKNFRIDWINNDVKVKALKKCPIYNEKEGIIEYYNPETEFHMSFWRAKLLEEQKIVKITSSRKLNFIEMDKLNYKEHENSELQVLPKNFFIDFLLLIKKSEDKSLRNRLYDNFNEVIDRRIYKILKIMTINKNSLKDFKERFSKEENYLYNGLKRFFESWKSKIINY